MKAEQQLVRTELELHAIDSAYAMIRYLGYRPGQDSWKAYCHTVNNKLSDAIYRAEYWENQYQIG